MYNSPPGTDLVILLSASATINKADRYSCTKMLRYKVQRVCGTGEIICLYAGLAHGKVPLWDLRVKGEI